MQNPNYVENRLQHIEKLNNLNIGFLVNQKDKCIEMKVMIDDSLDSILCLPFKVCEQKDNQYIFKNGDMILTLSKGELIRYICERHNQKRLYTLYLVNIGHVVCNNKEYIVNRIYDDQNLIIQEVDDEDGLTESVEHICECLPKEKGLK